MGSKNLWNFSWLRVLVLAWVSGSAQGLRFREWGLSMLRQGNPETLKKVKPFCPEHFFLKSNLKPYSKA